MTSSEHSHQESIIFDEVHNKLTMHVKDKIIDDLIYQKDSCDKILL